jgi:hypothetical protein
VLPVLAPGPCNQAARCLQTAHYFLLNPIFSQTFISMNYMKNFSVAIDSVTQDTILSNVRTALSNLNGIATITLTPEQRKTIPNVEANRYSYVQKAVDDFGPEYKDLVSRAVSTDKAKEALESYDFLTELQGLLLEFTDRATDLRHNLGNTTYNYTLDMYHEAQRYVADLPGADTVVQELKPLFEDQGPQNPDTPTP